MEFFCNFVKACLFFCGAAPVVDGTFDSNYMAFACSLLIGKSGCDQKVMIVWQVVLHWVPWCIQQTYAPVPLFESNIGMS